MPSNPTALAVPPQLELSSFGTLRQFNDTMTSYLDGGGSTVEPYTPYTYFPDAVNTNV
jgi:hypothetical protein